MQTNQLYLQKTGDDGFIEETGTSITAVSGNVGIGTTNPSGELHLYGDGPVLQVEDDSGPVAKVYAGDTEVQFGSWSDHPVRFNAGASEKMRILSNGNVGIGTSSPTCNLEIRGHSGEAESRVGLSSSDGTQNAAIAHVNDGSPRLSLRVGGFESTVDALSILNDGKVGIGTSSPVSALELAGTDTIDARLSFSQTTASKSGNLQQGSQGLGISALGADNKIFLATAGVDHFTLTSSGNVGIGTTAPDAPLTVHNSSDPEIRFGYNSTSGHRINWDSSKVFLEADPDDNNTNSTIGFRVDGSEKVRIDSDGNFGIGSTNPSHLLDVRGDAPTLMLRNTGAIGTSSELRLGVADNRHSYIKSERKDSGNGHSLEFGTNTGASSPEARMLIDTEGNVGIGTTNPSGKLHLYGDGPALQVEDNSGPVAKVYAGDAEVQFGSWSNHPVRFNVGASEKMRILSNGNVGIGTTDPSGILTIGGENSPEIKLISDFNSEFADAAISVNEAGSVTINADPSNNSSTYDTNFRVTVDGDEHMRISSNGNVGIGTASPLTKLDVHGTVSLNTSGAAAKGLWFGSGIEALGYMGASDYAVNGLTPTDFGISTATNGVDFTGALAFGIGATEKMRIDSNGNVGIGTTTPSGKLEIGGAGEGIVLNSPDGTQFLVTVANNGSVSGVAV